MPVGRIVAPRLRLAMTGAFLERDVDKIARWSHNGRKIAFLIRQPSGISLNNRGSCLAGRMTGRQRMSRLHAFGEDFRGRRKDVIKFTGGLSMKIGELTGKEALQRGLDATRDKATPKSDDFKELLAEEMSQTGAVGGSEGMTATAMGPVSGPYALFPGLDVNMTNSVQSVLDAVQAAGQRLDSIEQTMEGGGVTPKTMGRAIDALSREAASLQESLSVLPDTHPLRNVGDELNVLAYVESVKLKRGDYL